MIRKKKIIEEYRKWRSIFFIWKKEPFDLYEGNIKEKLVNWKIKVKVKKARTGIIEEFELNKDDFKFNKI